LLSITAFPDKISLSSSLVGLLKLASDWLYSSSGKPSEVAFIAHCVALYLSYPTEVILTISEYLSISVVI